VLPVAALASTFTEAWVALFVAVAVVAALVVTLLRSALGRMDCQGPDLEAAAGP